MLHLASTRIHPTTAMECPAPNLSLMPEVDMIAFIALVSVINEEPLLFNQTPEKVTMNDTDVTWTRIKSSTKHGRDHLTNSLRFAYIVSKKRTAATD